MTRNEAKALSDNDGPNWPLTGEARAAALEAALRAILKDLAHTAYQTADGTRLTASLAVREVRALVLLHDVISSRPLMELGALRAALHELVAESGAHDYRSLDGVNWMATPAFVEAAALLVAGV